MDRKRQARTTKRRRTSTAIYSQQTTNSGINEGWPAIPRNQESESESESYVLCTKHHSCIGIPDEMIEARIMVSISWTARSAGPVSWSSRCHLMLATSCQKLPLQFSFYNLAWAITDKHPWPNTNPSHKLQTDYRKEFLLRMKDDDFFSILSFHENAIIVVSSSRSDRKVSTRIYLSHVPF